MKNAIFFFLLLFSFLGTAQTTFPTGVRLPNATNETGLERIPVISPAGVVQAYITKDQLAAQLAPPLTLQDVTDNGNVTTNDIEANKLIAGNMQLQPQGLTDPSSANWTLEGIDSTLVVTPPTGGAYWPLGLDVAQLTERRNFTLPDKSGTVALLDDVSGGVASVVAGTNISVINTDPDNPIVNLVASPLIDEIGFNPANAVVSSQRGFFGYTTNDRFYFSNRTGTGQISFLDFRNLTSNRSFSFPDAAGTIALTGDIPSTYPWGSITGTPTTLSGYGIQGDADSRYVNVTGDTMTGSLYVNGEVLASVDTESGGQAKILGCVIRAIGGSWDFINDTGHYNSGFTSISSNATGDVTLTYNEVFDKTISFLAVVDETFAQNEVFVGATVGTGSATLKLFKRLFLGDLITYDGSSFVSTNGVFTIDSYASGVLTVSHRILLGALNDGFNAQVTDRDTSAYITRIGPITSATIQIKFYNFDGTQYTGAANTDMRFYLARNGLIQLTPDEASITNSNVWIAAVMQQD